MMQIKSAFSPLTAMDNSYADKYTFTKKVSASTNQISFTIQNDVGVNGTRWLLFITMQPQLQM